jgi:hypothetical protein
MQCYAILGNCQCKYEPRSELVDEIKITDKGVMRQTFIP